MHLKQLAYFLVIAEARSLTHAAVRLRVTQPALSRQIKDLEAEVGALLFDRHARGLALTEAGTVLYARANDIIKLVDAVKDEIAASLDEPAGDLVVALPAAFRRLISAKLICDYKRRYPRVRLCALELTTVERQEAVAAGDANLAITTTMDAEEGLILRPLVNEALFIVGSLERRFSPSIALSLQDVAQLPLVQNTRPNAMRVILEKALKRAGLTSRTEIEADALDMMIELVSTGPYCVAVPYSSIYNYVGTRKLSAAPITGVSVTWQVVVSSSRSASVAVKAFEDMLVSECSALIDARIWKTGQLIRR